MSLKFRILALGIAIVVNGAALMAVHAAMAERTAHEWLSLQQPARIVVLGRDHAEAQREIAADQSCASPKSL